MNNQADKKLRPVITNQQLSYLISLAESDSSSATKSIRIALLQYLKLFQAKVNLGIVSASYEMQGRRSIADKLGNCADPATRRLESYNLFLESPALCTPSQLSDVALYRYENDLMTPEEESGYEAAL